jgi:hypothetical protein
MRYQTPFLLIAGLVLCSVAAWAQSPWPCGCPCDPIATFPVLLQNDDLEPEELSPAERETEREVVAKLRSLKDAAGKQKCFVITEFADKRCTSISFMGGKIDDEMLKLTARLARVSTVNAEKCGISDDQLEYFAGLKSLFTLVLSNTPITSKGLVHVRPLTNLQALHLSNTKVSDAGLDDIAQLRHLKILNLSQTKVTDRAMKKLLPLTELKWLLLSETAITDAGLDELAPMRQLGRLTILKTRVTAAGVDRLKQAIPALSVDR